MTAVPWDDVAEVAGRLRHDGDPALRILADNVLTGRVVALQPEALETLISDPPPQEERGVEFELALVAEDGAEALVAHGLADIDVGLLRRLAARLSASSGQRTRLSYRLVSRFQPATWQRGAR